MASTTVTGSVFMFATISVSLASDNIILNKTRLKEQTVEMFNHAYNSYMKYAYPADELMPLTCAGRVRGITPNRGDIDDALGNFSLTLIDALDTLAVLGNFVEFDSASRRIVRDVSFDSDLVVSVFETNIRVVGGLLGAHSMALVVKQEVEDRMQWYTDQMLQMARQVADRLLPAFDTLTGVPHPRVNLKYGVDGPAHGLRSQVETCTACAGTMLLEFGALSRLTGEPVYERKARRAMDFLWRQRHSAHDLMGTIINVNTGDWIRRDSGVGAGIDSYYEYCFKAYVLLGDEDYLHRFNKHYSAVMKYISQGPVMIDVHMHNPTLVSKTFMDALLAFWPGLQVLKGDIKPAIEMHEILHQIVQKHNFLPEAFTHDFQVHWAQHPLRPEFVESTYFLYKATKDEHYLQIGAEILETLNKHVRVDCGFAAIKDLRSMTMEDRMDSFVLAETFKYLFLLFANRDDVIFDIDDYIFNTEAHLLPLHISSYSSSLQPKPTQRTGSAYKQVPNMPLMYYREIPEDTVAQNEENYSTTCPNLNHIFTDDGKSYASVFRDRLKNFVHKPPDVQSQQQQQQSFLTKSDELYGFYLGITPQTFDPHNADHVQKLKLMGISIVTQSDGKMQLVHSSAKAVTPWLGEEGFKFMQAMIDSINNQPPEELISDRVVQIVSWPDFGRVAFLAFPAQFGAKFDDSTIEFYGKLVTPHPFNACSALKNLDEVAEENRHKTFALALRGDCMFAQKARHAEAAGLAGVIVIDNIESSDASKSAIFSMAGDGKNDVRIPTVFLNHENGRVLQDLLSKNPNLVIRVAQHSTNPAEFFFSYLTRKRKVSKSKKPGKKVHKIQKILKPPKTTSKNRKKTKKSTRGKYWWIEKQKSRTKNEQEAKKEMLWSNLLEQLFNLRKIHSDSNTALKILDEKISELLQFPDSVEKSDNQVVTVAKNLTEGTVVEKDIVSENTTIDDDQKNNDSQNEKTEL